MRILTVLLAVPTVAALLLAAQTFVTTPPTAEPLRCDCTTICPCFVATCPCNTLLAPCTELCLCGGAAPCCCGGK